MPQFVGIATSGVNHDVFAYNASGAVWNGSAYVAWVDGNYATYRIAATEKGASSRFEATLPAGAARWELRKRAGTLAASTVEWEEAVPYTGAGSGAFVYTVTVTTNGTTPINGARVRLAGGAETRYLVTGADGVAAFSVDAGSYSLAITASGYSYTPTTVSISASTSATITMTAVSIPAAVDPDQTNAYTTCRDGQGDATSGVVLTFALVDPNPTVDSYDISEMTATSGVGGLLTIPLLKSSKYKARRGRGSWVFFTTGSGSTYELPQVLSHPQN